MFLLGAVSGKSRRDSVSKDLRSRDAKPTTGAETSAEGGTRDRHHACRDAQGTDQRSQGRK